MLLRFFRWFCDPRMVEDIEGDLVERFEIRLRKKGAQKARWLLVKDIMQLFRPGIIKTFKGSQKLNYYDMFKHNLLISLRGFQRHKSAFFINLIGLTSGLTCALLIFLWMQDERQIDSFHELNDRLYQVMLNHEESGTLRTDEHTQGLMAENLEKEVPEVLRAIEGTPAVWFGKMPLTYDDKTVKAEGKFMGSGFFELFTYPLIQGDPSQVLTNKESIVISESLAISIFGTTEDVVGKTLNWSLLHWKKNLMITGIMEDVTSKSTEKFDFILPWGIFKEMLGEQVHWGNYNAMTFVLLKEHTDVEALNAKLGPFVKERDNGSNVNVFLRPYGDKYLYNKYENGVQAGGRIEYIQLFSAIAVFILIIACINFMNLSTAKAARRTKEIGVKKAIGAGRRHLIAQYLEESLLLTFLSGLVALALVWLLLPQFNAVTGKSIVLTLSSDLLLPLLAIVFITGLVAGSYPALYLSGFKPVEILKGKLKSSTGALWARKGLVVFQFALSVILIVGVMVVYQQIDFVQNRNLGYDRENLLVFGNEGRTSENIKGFIAEIENIPGVLNAGATSHPIVQDGGYTTGISWPGKDPETEVRFGNMTVTGNFVETLGLNIIQGRVFDSNKTTDHDNKLIFNETAIEVMGLTDPVGQTIEFWGRKAEIIGVVEDFHFQSLHEEISPLFLRVDETALTSVVVRIAPGQVRETLDRLDKFYRGYNEGFTFDFRFLDQNYQEQYEAEERISTLSRFFAAAAIIISCLGLFGLAAFTAERKTKEIGIRKALGASTSNIVRLLSSDFNRIVGLSIIIALPLSYLLVKDWLAGFAYTIDLNVWYFAGAGLSAMFIAWLTVGVQTYRAARVNPTQSLRSE